MDMTTVFPSRFYKAADIEQPTLHRIGQVVQEAMQDGALKPVMYFTGVEKALVLNQTNTNELIRLFGKESNAWTGREIVLFVGPVGRQKQPGVLVREPGAGEKPAKAKAAKIPKYAELKVGEFDDDIPPL